MHDSAWKARMNSFVAFFYGPLHMEAPVFADQEKNYCHQLCVNTGYNLENLPGAIAREGESGKSMLSVQFAAAASVAAYGDDEDDYDDT